MSLSPGVPSPSSDEIFAAVEATWPPAAWHDVPGWRVGEGRGGGKRVSAGRATAAAPDPAELEAAHRAIGQAPLAMLRPEETALDAVLAARGFTLLDPTLARVAPVARLVGDPPPVTVFDVPMPPLEVQREIWQAAGIGAARIAVMARAEGPAMTLMGRRNDTPCATAFLACHGRMAVIHALEVSPAFQRKGMGLHMMAGAALWAEQQGVELLMALVTEANMPANRLYEHLGMQAITRYHYRLLRENG